MKKTIPILLSAALLLSACGQAAGTAETTSADAPAAVTETTAQTSAPKTTPGGVDKAETVYAKADAGGTVTETTVETVLKARDGATIEDVAALRDIINKEGDEAYTTGADNALTWENSGNAITYEGKSDAGIAGGRLHNHAARLELAAAFGRVNDTFRDAVFGRASRIEIFDFDGDGGFDAVGHVAEFDERSVADEFGKGIVDGHGVSLQMIVYWLPMDDFVVFDFEKLAFVTCNFENGTCDGVFTAVHPHM